MMHPRQFPTDLCFRRSFRSTYIGIRHRRPDGAVKLQLVGGAGSDRATPFKHDVTVLRVDDDNASHGHEPRNRTSVRVLK